MSLLDDLVAAYELDDTTDSSGNGFTLTNNNGATFGGGKVTLVRASSQYLSRSSSSEFQVSPTQGFTVEAWVTPASLDAFAMVASKNTEWDLRINGAGNGWQFSNSFTGTSATDGTPVIGELAHILAWQADGGGTLNIRVNNAAAVSASESAGAASGSDFEIGARGGANTFNGGEHAFRFWRRALTTVEQDTLWNGGTVLPFAGFAPVATRSNRLSLRGGLGRRRLPTTLTRI